MQAALRRCVVLRQYGGASGGGSPIAAAAARLAAHQAASTEEKKVSLQNAMQMELKRRRELVAASDTRYTVVQEPRRPGRTGRAIGIDLGTTNSCVSYLDPITRKPKIIPSPTGSWVYPTAVTFDQNHLLRLYGEEARACVRTSASATLCSGKRLIGRSLGELGRVQSDMSKTNVLTLNEKGEVAVEILGRSYAVVHIIAMFLRYLKREAERFLKEPVDLAVVSVPAYFTPQQKVATEDAALSAGFDVLEVIDEPSAACLTYTVLRQHPTDDAVAASRPKRIERSLVFDLGGGTLDCALLEHDRRRHRFTLVATHGDSMLGGNDWDAVLSQYFADQFVSKWRVPLEDEGGNVGQGLSTHRALALEAEKAKIHFTHSTETYHGYNRAFHFSEALRDIVPLEATLSLEDYVRLTRPLRVRCLDCVDTLLTRAHVTPAMVDHVLLVGAMTRDPPVRHMLEEYFHQPAAPDAACPADYAVAFGAAIRAGMLQGAFPALAANTRFVSGSTQAARSGPWLARLGSVVGRWWGGDGWSRGVRWRGRARGLRDDEIAAYAKELVEFEAATERRALLERAESEANRLMRRVTADSNRRQGMQEQRIRQLCDQLKFWQYMVHNFHDHEDELGRTVLELQRAMDEVDGLVEDNASGLTAHGTIDFSNAVHKALGSRPSSPTPPRVENAAATDPPPADPVAPKILRRKPAPLPAQSADAQELVQAGHPALRNAEVAMSDTVRSAFLEQQVEDRAWHEPPTPPGESGSWRTVQEMLQSGEEVGTAVMEGAGWGMPVLHELEERLRVRCPLDDVPSAEYQAKLDEAARLQTVTVVHGAVDMVAVELALRAEEDEVRRLTAQRVKETGRSVRMENKAVSQQRFGGTSGEQQTVQNAS